MSITEYEDQLPGGAVAVAHAPVRTEAPAQALPVIMAPCAKLATALASIMGEVGIVAKQGHNDFHNYDYVKVEDLLQRVTPLLSKHGLVILQTEVERSLMDNDKAVAIKYAFTLIHSSGEIWPERLYQTGMATCRHRNGTFDDKALNKAHTAARKYFLLALLQIPTGDEQDDSDSGEVPERHNKPVQEPTYSRAERAAVDWNQKFFDFKRIIQSITEEDAFQDWMREHAPEISGFPPYRIKELREIARLQRDLIRSAAKQVAPDTDNAELPPATSISQRAIDARTEGKD